MQARSHGLVLSVILWVISLGLEGTGAALMVVLDAAYLREVAIMVFGLQLLPGIVALIAYLTYVIVQWRIESHMRELANAVETMKDNEKQVNHVVKVQAAFRRFRAVQERKRLKELKVWQSDDMMQQRWVLIGFVYSCLFLVVGLSFYVVLLYGVIFTPEQARAWIIASFVSFLTDIFIQEPVIQLGLSIVDFVRKLTETSARSIVLASLASRAGLSVADIAAGLKQSDMHRSRRSVGGASMRTGVTDGGASTFSHRRSTVTFADLLVAPSRADIAREAALEEANARYEEGQDLETVMKSAYEIEEVVDSDQPEEVAQG